MELSHGKVRKRCSSFAGVLLAAAAVLSFPQILNAQELADVPPVESPSELPASDDPVTLLSNAVQTGQLLPNEFSGKLIDELLAHPVDSSRDIRIKNPDLQRIFATVLERRLRDFLETHTADEALPYKRIADQTIESGSDGARAIERVFSLVERADGLVEKGDAARLVSLREDVANKEDRALLEPRVEKFLATAAEQAIAANRGDQALVYLAEAHAEETLKKRDELVSAAVAQLTEQAAPGIARLPSWPFENEQVLKMLSSDRFRGNRNLISQIAALFEQKILQLLSMEDAQRAGVTWNTLLRLRPDPDGENDSFRRRIASAASGPHAKAFATARLTELERSGQLGTLYKLRLALTGFYGPAIPILVVFTIIGVVAISALFILKPEWLGLAPPSERGYLKPAEAEDEKSRLLKKLGLEEDSSDDVIKAAYRQLAKEHHPDRLKDIPEEERLAKTRRFDEVKKAYDRLIERDRSGFRR